MRIHTYLSVKLNSRSTLFFENFHWQKSILLRHSPSLIKKKRVFYLLPLHRSQYPDLELLLNSCSISVTTRLVLYNRKSKGSSKALFYASQRTGIDLDYKHKQIGRGIHLFFFCGWDGSGRECKDGEGKNPERGVYGATLLTTN